MATGRRICYHESTSTRQERTLPRTYGVRAHTIVLGIFAIAVLAHGTAQAQSDSSSSVSLASLRGTMIWTLGEEVTVSGTFWAKGDWSRSEMRVGDAKVIVIQISDTLYTYREHSTRGEKSYLGQGLGSMGLVRQIEVMRTRGKRKGMREFGGVEYEMYEYEGLSGETAVALLSPTTRLPRIWSSAIKTSDGQVSIVTTGFKDLEADVAIPDEMFALPDGVEYVPAARNTQD